ncbi:class I SAM-dependent methyltransferase [Roseateles sp. DAIF2]|uniref:class I SAM-dependent methyltransferase n=1 Tax=Roseateles sp. DAIF2 TaxID=2714952 RepID=UPI0018A3210D|nr:class I SAM-dependent methyltransferase [Roseateles sp. DAIF2]QPF72657.1 class I SAM-dependent methyltransferase [Roseateles sp. DAIF2]
MSLSSDARFWDRNSRRYTRGAIADPAGYQRTLDRTRALLAPAARVLELGCGSGVTARALAGGVRAYLATDLSAGMIAIAEEKNQAQAEPALPAPRFRVATAETLLDGEEAAGSFDAVLGFNYLHQVRDLAGTLRSIHGLLAPRGLFISKTPCLADMHPLLRRALLPAMQALRLAPYAGAFRAAELGAALEHAGFELLAIEYHASRGRDRRPYIVARRLNSR